MLAGVFEKEGQFCLKEVPVPTIENPTQVKIKVAAVSICETDLHITSVPAKYIATPNTILGHEFVGEIVEIGQDVTTLKPGDKVVINPNDYCCVCDNCRNNLPTHCRQIKAMGIDVNGAFAPYVVTSEKTCYKISPKVSNNAAACVEPLACALNGFEKVQIKAGCKVAIIGASPIGLMIAMLVQQTPCGQMDLFEINEKRIDFAKSISVGNVYHTSNTQSPAFLQQYDHVFDMTGSQLKTAMTLVKNTGDIVLFGVNKEASTELLPFEITTREITVYGSWLANATFSSAVAVLENNVIDIEKLITHKFDLSQIQDALNMHRNGDAVKVIVTP